MAVKYQNPPVVYSVAKLIFAESIGSYSDEKYKKLLSELSVLGFESYSISKVMGVQLKQSDNQFSALPANVERVGYFSINRSRCAIIDENTLELRLSEYDNHRRFLDDFKSLIEICTQHDIAKGNKLREVELHYVDLFVPDGTFVLNDMFSETVTLPMTQFYSDDNDAIKVGATNFTRVLGTGKSKVSVSLEQLVALNPERRKYLPDALSEPDQKLSMPLHIERLFNSTSNVEYAIVHTACGTLIDTDRVDTSAVRDTLEQQYLESRKTFDHMINASVCENVWKVEEN